MDPTCVKTLSTTLISFNSAFQVEMVKNELFTVTLFNIALTAELRNKETCSLSKVYSLQNSLS